MREISNGQGKGGSHSTGKTLGKLAIARQVPRQAMSVRPLVLEMQSMTTPPRTYKATFRIDELQSQLQCGPCTMQ